MKTMPSIPTKPVDGFRFEWWIAGQSWSVIHCHAVYHVNSSWEEVCPGRRDDDRAFVNQWQIFEGGEFRGHRSNNGWCHALVGCIPDDAFVSETAALQAHQFALVQCIDRAEIDLARWRQELKEVTARLNGGDGR